jgi:ABC-type transport system substrate-binding protein
MEALRAAIPGQSLTTEPKGHPWERPPEITDPEEAIQMHLTRISDPEVLQAILDVIEFGELDVKTITQGVLRGAVANGLHNIDVALIVAPVIHEFIKQGAIAFGLNPEDGFDNKKEKEEYKKARNTASAKKILAKMGNAPKMSTSVKEVSMPVAEKEEKPRGLMSRGGV